jgi:hypothetical protein
MRLHADEPPDDLTKIHFCEHVRAVHADSQTRNVDAFTDHVHRHEPLLLPLSGERLDGPAGRRIIRNGDSGFRSRAFFHERGDGSGMFLIHADDETRRIRLLLLPQSRQLLVRIHNHRPQPTFLKQRRLQAFALALKGEAVFKRRPVFPALREPAQLALIAREDNRTAHPVSTRFT